MYYNINIIHIISMVKTLVLFVFHIINERVLNFIENCIFYDENIDFIVISNDKNNKINVQNYVKVLYRDNIGFDFGGWSDALLNNELYKNYDSFIFANSSIIGPFLPSYYKNKWTDVYLNGLQNNVKLFGSTINTCKNPLNKAHVQSYIFSMDKITLEYLIKCDIFNNTNYSNNYQDAVDNKEVLMSRKIIENGWNIGSLLPYYENVDFTFKLKKPEDYNFDFLCDLMFEYYNNKLWNKHQLVFVKGNRIQV
jgi:lipopolysaccharide biosynthesis protein